MHKTKTKQTKTFKILSAFIILEKTQVNTKESLLTVKTLNKYDVAKKNL